MFIEVITTVTSKVDLETMTPQHDVVVSSDDPIPSSVAMAMALNGCRAAVNSLEEQSGLGVTGDEEEE